MTTQARLWIYIKVVFLITPVTSKQVNYDFLGLCKNAYNISVGQDAGKTENDCFLPWYLQEPKTSHIFINTQNLLNEYTTKQLLNILTDKRWYKHSYKQLGVKNIQFNPNQDNGLKIQLDITTQRQKQEDHGLHLATKYMVDLAREMVCSGNHTFTDEHLFKIHHRVLGNVFRNFAGKYRKVMLWYKGRDPYEYSHQIPQPCEVQQLMDQFFIWFNGPASHSLHPVDKAVRTYLNLMFIHPFVDGNGRTGRLVMNLILLIHNLPPVGITEGPRHYRASKRAMYDGNTAHFTRFIIDSMRTMRDYMDGVLG